MLLVGVFPFFLLSFQKKKTKTRTQEKRRLWFFFFFFFSFFLFLFVDKRFSEVIMGFSFEKNDDVVGLFQKVFFFFFFFFFFFAFLLFSGLLLCSLYY